MPATKILWGQLLAVFAIVLVTTWSATQWMAWRLGYQAELGAPWFYFAGHPVYPPPAFFWWWYFYDAYAPEIFYEGAAIAASGGFLAIAVAIGMSVWRAREAKEAQTYGSARWATADEIRTAGLLGQDGVVLVNHIDTSDFYGPHVTNQLIREALSPYPADLTIVTKIGARRGDDGRGFPPSARTNSRGRSRTICATSG